MAETDDFYCGPATSLSGFRGNSSAHANDSRLTSRARVDTLFGKDLHVMVSDCFIAAPSLLLRHDLSMVLFSCQALNTFLQHMFDINWLFNRFCASRSCLADKLCSPDFQILVTLYCVTQKYFSNKGLRIHRYDTIANSLAHGEDTLSTMNLYSMNQLGEDLSLTSWFTVLTTPWSLEVKSSTINSICSLPIIRGS